MPPEGCSAEAARFVGEAQEGELKGFRESDVLEPGRLPGGGDVEARF